MPGKKEVHIHLPHNWREIVKESAKERREIFVSEKEIADALRWLQASRASYAEVTRPAQEGDSVDIDFEIKNEGQALPGGKAENHKLIIGAGGYLPGFEKEIVGMKTGEEKNFSLPVPETFWAKEIAGKNVDLHLKVKSVQDRDVPELNDSFAQSVGKFKNIDALKKSVGEGLRVEKEEKEKERFRLFVLSKIEEKSEIEYPDELLENEINLMLGELKASVGGMSLPWPEYLNQVKKSEEDLRKGFRPQGERRVRYALILRAIAEEERIEPDAEEVEKEMNRFLSQFSSPEVAEKNIDVVSLANYTKGVLRNEKVFQLLEKIAE